MKSLILDILRKQEGRVSGEDLSRLLGVSRTSIWKYINELRRDGYIIDSITHKGYLLKSAPDSLNPLEISNNLKTEKIGKDIKYFETIGSTSSYAKEIATQGCIDGTVILAEEQTLGRGRLGRNWVSAKRKGIWMSLVLKPNLLPSEVQLVTLAASVAVVEGIEEATGLTCGIKWPNDIILNERKVCGILTEMSCETDGINYIVLGIGINANQTQDEFPDELRKKATSLKLESGKNINRALLTGMILNKIEKYYMEIINRNKQVIIDKWKEFSMTLGKKVRICSSEIEYNATAIDILQDGRLLVEDDSGRKHKILSGEISVRGIMGYV